MTTRKRLTPGKEKIVAARQDYKCATCREILPSTWELDHVIELWQGGTNDLDNFQVLCPNCHRKKTQLAAIAREDAKRAGNANVSPHFRNIIDAANATVPPKPIPPFVQRRQATKKNNWARYFCCSSSAD